MARTTRARSLIRYAVVGQGYISQAAVLPAFRHARANSRLVALVSGDETKRRELGRKYNAATYGYDEYDACLASGDVDAVYIALPNTMHREYTVRAARHLFGAEPIEVSCVTTRHPKPGSDVDESACSILRFPGDRLAMFCTSFGAGKTSEYRVIGSKGSMRVDPGYELARGLELRFERDGKKRTIKYARRDQFAPELIHFSDCILQDRQPEPSGEEGAADVRVIQVLYKSARTGRPVRLDGMKQPARPSMRREITKPPVRMPRLVHTTPPSG